MLVWVVGSQTVEVYSITGCTKAVYLAVTVYLGVIISNNLSWNKPIDNIKAKGNRSLGFVRRNLKNCSRSVKTARYTALVHPVIEYTSTVWDPTTQTSINSLELIQRSAGLDVINRFIPG
jgi:hypothetical protein